MPATHYRLFHWGELVGKGAMQARHVSVTGIAKSSSGDQPFAVASELICSNLARALLLPVPPGFIVEKDGVPFFVSLNFHLSGHNLPPADCAALAATLPDIAAGVVAFDMWVLNGDRHEENIAFDAVDGQAMIFDHSHALIPTTHGPELMLKRATDVAIHGHCLAPYITSYGILDVWFEKIRSVPRFFIEGVINAATRVGLPPDSADSCARFLIERAGQLRGLSRIDPSIFPNIALDLLDVEATAETEASGTGGAAEADSVATAGTPSDGETEVEGEER